jgi:multiple sugar transport system ATP-binding protein
MTLELTNVSKSFKKDLVFEKVSFSVAAGQTLVLFGPSGTGKTVLLRLIAGVIDPDEGDIRINGNDMAGVEPENRGVGMAFQNFALLPHMDAHANIASPLTARGQSQGLINEGVTKLAKLLKIDHVLGHKPKELSNGQKQRTALARALAGNPQILLLDDPLRNVDAKLRFEMRLELPRLLRAQNATVIYVTQDYKEAMALGDKIAVMNDRGIRQIGTPEEIYLAPADMNTARLFGDPVINLLDVVPERTEKGIVVRVSDQEMGINPGFRDYVGHNCVLGIRPETIRFAEENTPNAVPVSVETETPLNEKTITLMVTKHGRELMASRPAGTPGPHSDHAFVSFEAARSLLFDKATGIRLRSEDDKAKEVGAAA